MTRPPTRRCVRSDGPLTKPRPGTHQAAAGATSTWSAPEARSIHWSGPRTVASSPSLPTSATTSSSDGPPTVAAHQAQRRSLRSIRVSQAPYVQASAGRILSWSRKARRNNGSSTRGSGSNFSANHRGRTSLHSASESRRGSGCHRAAAQISRPARSTSGASRTHDTRSRTRRPAGDSPSRGPPSSRRISSVFFMVAWRGLSPRRVVRWAPALTKRPDVRFFRQTRACFSPPSCRALSLMPP